MARPATTRAMAGEAGNHARTCCRERRALKMTARLRGDGLSVRDSTVGSNGRQGAPWSNAVIAHHAGG
jgi:hypothetical protein